MTTKSEMMSSVKDAVKSKIVANNTIEYIRSNGERVIQLHHTDIVTFSTDGRSVTLDSGGWRTHTTRDRMSAYSNVRISQVKGSWYVDGVPYYDGITIVDGKVPIADNKIVKDEAKLAKQINSFIEKIKKLDTFSSIKE